MFADKMLETGKQVVEAEINLYLRASLSGVSPVVMI